MDGGSVLILLLTLFVGIEQHVAQATNLLCFIPSALISIIINSKRKNINFKNAFVLIFFGIIGAICGALISERISVAVLRKFFGVFLLFISAYEIHSYYILYIKNKKNT